VKLRLAPVKRAPRAPDAREKWLPGKDSNLD
jgi:hypothetical protein